MHTSNPISADSGDAEITEAGRLSAQPGKLQLQAREKSLPQKKQVGSDGEEHLVPYSDLHVCAQVHTHTCSCMHAHESLKSRKAYLPEDGPVFPETMQCGH